MSYFKVPTHRSESWLAKVRKLDCVLCYAPAPSEAAHRNETKGMGMKTHDCWTAALCHKCHSEIDQGRDMSREERRARLDVAILLTIKELATSGAIK